MLKNFRKIMEKKSKFLLEEDFNDEEILELKNTLNEIEELYKETKNHFDGIKNIRNKSFTSLEFLSRQTSNLIDIKKTKLQVLKQISEVKNKSFNQKLIVDKLEKEKKELEENNNTGSNMSIHDFVKKAMSLYSYDNKINNIDDIDILLEQRLLEENNNEN
jgi:hypothetical protein